MATNLNIESTRPAVATQLIDIIRDMMGDWDDDFEGEITPESLLIADLGFQSVDVVQLIVAIETEFDRRELPWEELLMKNERYEEDVSLGAMARFLESHI